MHSNRLTWKNDLDAFLQRGQVIDVIAGEHLPIEPELQEKIIILLEGRLELSYQDRDSPGIFLNAVEEGEPIFETSWQPEDKAGYQVSALIDSKVLLLSQTDFGDLLRQSAGICDVIFKSLSRRIRETDQKIYDAHTREGLYARLLTEEKKNKHIELAGSHSSVKQIRKLIGQYSANSNPAYLVGEKGTGKELAAWLIHRESSRSQRPFIVVECSELIEDELGERLFGNLQSLSNSREMYRFGYLELARGGSILFKDIDRLGPLVLIRLAAFLENNFLDVRFMAASRKPFVQQFWEKGLQDEVIAQIMADPLVIPPLRDRMRDLPQIIEAALSKLGKKYNRQTPVINTEAQEKLLAYSYKNANIAELEEILERALVLADGDIITAEHIFTGLVAESPGAALDILQNNAVRQVIKKEYFPRLPQLALTAGLWAFIAAAFVGSNNLVGSLVLLSAWALGWPALILSASFVGRFTCSICPFAGTASIAQGLKNYNLPIPPFIKKYDYILISFLFTLIFWVEEISNMRHSPVATGLLLLTITTGAVIFAVLFPRHIWCRHICPLGGMVGVCSMVSLVELRSRVDVCHHKCTGYNCYRGSGPSQGCPLYQHLSFVDNNVSCKLCMRCVLNCPNDAVQLNLRPPAREIWRTRHINRGLVVFVLVFAAMLLPIGLFEMFGVGIPDNIAFFTAIYWGTVFTAGLAGWMFVRNRLNGDDALPVVRTVFCLVPLALGAHFAFQLQFVPYLADLQLFLHHLMPGGPEEQLVLITVLSLFRIFTLICGLLLTLVCLLFARKEVPAGEKRYLFIAACLAVAYFAAITVLLLGRQ
ncbi:MAG: sigma 54-interacting transcriptional regulator [Bacillota bacterium]